MLSAMGRRSEETDGPHTLAKCPRWSDGHSYRDGLVVPLHPFIEGDRGFEASCSAGSSANLFTASARAGANLVPKKLPGPLPRPTGIRCRFIYASDPGGSPSGKRMLRITTACPSLRPIAIRSSRVSQRMV
jgi:hypothetical protein